MRDTLRNTLLITAATAVLTACAVGPDFQRPAAPDTVRYTEADLPSKTVSAEGMAGAAQTFASDQDVPRDWWKEFGSEPLNRLMEQALKANPDVKTAQASLRQAQENYYAERGELLPSVDAGFDPTREKFNPSAFGQQGVPSSIFTLYDASVSVSYGVDIFGGTRRAVEGAGAQVDTQRYALQAAYLTLTANVVTAAVQEASLEQQIKETQNIADIESKQLDVLQKQFELGGVTKATVLSQVAELAQTQTNLPPLQKQLAQTRNQLAVLAGKFPGDGKDDIFDLASLHLPETLPLTLPSKLVEQRPDIKQAEGQLHAASAEIGVATAAMLPQVTLSGSYGSETTSFSKLFTSGAEVWSLGGGILQPLFHGGTLLHQRRAAEAAYDKSAAQYQSTVLLAFKNVADTLRALQFDAEGLKAQVNAERAASNSLNLSQTQFRVGAISYPQLLDAQHTYSQARIGLVQAIATRLADTAALYQALGGGWQGKDTTIAQEKTPGPAKDKSDAPPAVEAPLLDAPAASFATTPAVPAAGNAPAATAMQPSVTNEKKP
jgi:NodT family efflux transporter outer membrane factor (OMF) lipoprotein